MTTDIEDFLSSAGWDTAERRLLAGDASARCYWRLVRGAERAVLMQAPPDGSCAAFARIARHLSGLGLSAPAILAAELDAGLMLLEDFGDAVYAREISRDPALEMPLYAAATDMLLELHRSAPPKGLTQVDSATMSTLAGPALDFYVHLGATAPAADHAALASQLAWALAPHDGPRVLSLRDFHAENLIWLPDRQGAARVGLLDFQDAVAAHPAYDMVSMLRDARRDVAPDVARAMTARYVAGAGIDPERFGAAMAANGAQRNLRILGIFARLSLSLGKPQYLELIPRVWQHLQADLAHPDLAQLRSFLAETLPEPGPAHLNRLRPAA